MKRLILILAFLLVASTGWGAVVEGTSAGFVAVAPSADPAGSEISREGLSVAYKTTSPAGALRITEIGFWVADTEAYEPNYDIGFYNHDVANDRPDTLQQVSRNNVMATTPQWEVVTGLNWPVTENTIYWLAIQVDTTSGDRATDQTYNTSYKMDYKNSQTELPVTWGASTGSETRIQAIYAVYSTTSGSVRRITIDE